MSCCWIGSAIGKMESVFISIKQCQSLRFDIERYMVLKKKSSDTGSRTRVCSVKANRASRYTISEFSYAERFPMIYLQKY